MESTVGLEEALFLLELISEDEIIRILKDRAQNDPALKKMLKNL
jgi:hypothetical protein